MTDNEIIKAIKCCTSSNSDECLQCPLHNDFYPNKCHYKRTKNAADLINRQKADIESLKAERDNYKEWYFSTVEENEQLSKDLAKTADCEYCKHNCPTAVKYEKWADAYMSNVKYHRCTGCGEYVEDVCFGAFVYKYCPNCGARMEGGE